MGDRVLKRNPAVQVGLPVLRKDAQIIFPASFIETFADRIRHVPRVASTRGSTGRICRAQCHRPDDFAGGVEEQRMPEIARDGFFSLAAFAEDSILHGIGDAVRRFMK